MKFVLSEEQRAFSASIDQLLGNADTPTAIRAWAGGDHDPGLRIWQSLAELGITALAVPETHGGLEAQPSDLVVALERIGYYAVPGPYVESIAVLPRLLRGGNLGEQWLPRIASGELRVSIAWPPHVPYPVDADIATDRIAVDNGELRDFAANRARTSVDRARKLFDFTKGQPLDTVSDTAAAFEFGALATTAILNGAAASLLDSSVSYAKQREQYGHPIGSYQAVKHLLADVATQLELARPLLHGAAVAVADQTTTVRRDVSAAKVAAADVAHLAARTALQVHGAIGYTAEHDLGLWLTKVRALIPAWGTQSFHRARVLSAISQGNG